MCILVTAYVKAVTSQNKKDKFTLHAAKTCIMNSCLSRCDGVFKQCTATYFGFYASELNHQQHKPKPQHIFQETQLSIFKETQQLKDYTVPVFNVTRIHIDSLCLIFSPFASARVLTWRRFENVCSNLVTWWCSRVLGLAPKAGCRPSVAMAASGASGRLR